MNEHLDAVARINESIFGKHQEPPEREYLSEAEVAAEQAERDAEIAQLSAEALRGEGRYWGSGWDDPDAWLKQACAFPAADPATRWRYVEHKLALSIADWATQMVDA